ncbi:hypothetical protein F4818DRAFT_456347 [Hypoxylon cercidicola]|nr:hypothetical protein F4818DRAFT_456347 [Hypoxylon cercidicola]
MDPLFAKGDNPVTTLQYNGKPRTSGTIMRDPASISNGTEETSNEADGANSSDDDVADAHSPGVDIKKKKKKKKKKKTNPKSQIDPPSIPISQLFPNNTYPKGEEVEYKDEN